MKFLSVIVIDVNITKIIIGFLPNLFLKILICIIYFFIKI